MFEIHGDWKIVVKGNYVLQWFSGCWNEEAAIQYSEDFLNKTGHLRGTSWAIVSFFDEWELGVPEIEPHLVAHCQRFISNGCTKDCHIYTPAAAKSMQLENIVPHTNGGYERRVFTNADDAIAWMKVCQFNINIDGFIEKK